MYATNSLILQYGLSQEKSEFDHPQVAGWAPTYRGGQNDPRYQMVMDWIRNVLIPVEPDYGIDFQIPGQPANPPANGAKPPADQAKPPAGDQPKTEAKGQK